MPVHITVPAVWQPQLLAWPVPTAAQLACQPLLGPPGEWQQPPSLPWLGLLIPQLGRLLAPWLSGLLLL